MHVVQVLDVARQRQRLDLASLPPTRKLLHLEKPIQKPTNNTKPRKKRPHISLLGLGVACDVVAQLCWSHANAAQGAAVIFAE